MIEVVVVNETTVLTDESKVWTMAWCLNYACKKWFNKVWGYNVRVIYAPKGFKPQVDQWVMQLLDTSDQQGAIGYHTEDGNEVPIIKVFVKTAIEDKADPTAVAAHELFETVVDPHTDLMVLTGDNKKLIAYEVGDPVQGADFDVFDGMSKTAGFKVCDFVLPSWFDPNTPANQITSLRGTVRGPFTLAPQGYISYIDTGNFAAGWQDGFGSERSEIPPWATRVPARRGS